MSILNRTNLQDDQTPILGGDLDANSKDISNINNLTVDGNLTVHGTTVTLNTSTLDVEDNVITVNNGETGAGVTAGTAGITVDRGTSTDASFLYTESTDSWDIGSKKIQNLASPVSANDAATKGYVDASAIGVLVTHSGTGAQLDKTTTRSKDHDFRTLVAGSNVTITQNANDISISSTDTDTTYTAGTGLNLTGTAFSLDSTLSGLSDVSGTAPSTGQVLKWDGAAWAPAADNDTGETNTASNLGSGAEVFKQKSNEDLQFRSLTAGANVTVTENASTISISSTDTDTTYSAGTGLALTGTSFSINANVDDLADTVITTPVLDDVLQWNGSNWVNAQIEEEGTTASNLGATGASVFAQKVTNDLEFRKIKAGSNISITQNANDIEISSTATGAVLSVNSQTGAVVLDTDDISEGTAHLYYTDARVDTRVGNLSIDALSDVDTTTAAPTNGQTLTWNSTASKWEPSSNTHYTDTDFDNRLATKDTGDLAEGTNLYYTDARVDTRISNTNINALSDVAVTSVADNQFLRYDTAGGVWQNETVSLYSDSDVDTHLNQSNPTAGYVLSWNGSDYAWVSNGIASEINDLSASVTWVNVPDAYITQSSVTQHQAALQITESQITNLQHYADSDVDAHLNQSNPTSGYVLSWNGTDYAWVDNAGYTDSDVDTHLNQSNPTAGYVLSWNGTDYAWVSNGLTSIAANSINDTHIDWGTGANQVSTADIPEDTNLYYTDARVSSRMGVSSINVLADVNLAFTADNQFLRYDSASGNWQNETVTFYDDGDVDNHLNQSTATTNDVLSWNGTDYAWVAQSGGGGGGGGSFTGDLDGNDLIDTASTNGRVNIAQWTGITQSVTNPTGANQWDAALTVENLNHSGNNGETNSAINIYKSINSTYDQAALYLNVDDSADPTKSTGLVLGVQGNGANRLLMQANIKDASYNNYYFELGSFNAGQVNAFGKFGQGVKFNYGVNMTPVAQGEYIQSNLANWNLSWGNPASNNVFEQLRGYHFNISTDSNVPVTQLAGPVDWEDLLGDPEFPDFGSKSTFEFAYTFGYYNTPQTPYVDGLFPYWSGQNSYGQYSPNIMWEGGSRPSWITFDGKTQNLTSHNTAIIFIKLVFVNGIYDVFADAKIYY